MHDETTVYFINFYASAVGVAGATTEVLLTSVCILANPIKYESRLWIDGGPK